MKIYKVGGAVRDEFMGQKSKDLDFSVEATSYEEMRDFIALNGTIWQERPDFLTIRAKMPGLGDADFVLCRRDGFYSDGRRPDNVIPGTIYDDLARRDFTMNAIAINIETNEVIDPYNGKWDIRNGFIRCVGDAYDRFSEDALRLMRALRFRTILDFKFDVNVKVCLQNKYLADKLHYVSIERIMEELNKMFRHDTYFTFTLLNSYPYIRDEILTNPKLHLEAFVK